MNIEASICLPTNGNEIEQVKIKGNSVDISDLKKLQRSLVDFQQQLNTLLTERMKSENSVDIQEEADDDNDDDENEDEDDNES